MSDTVASGLQVLGSGLNLVTSISAMPKVPVKEGKVFFAKPLSGVDLFYGICVDVLSIGDDIKAASDTTNTRMAKIAKIVARFAACWFFLEFFTYCSAAYNITAALGKSFCGFMAYSKGGAKGTLAGHVVKDYVDDVKTHLIIAVTDLATCLIPLIPLLLFAFRPDCFEGGRQELVKFANKYLNGLDVPQELKEASQGPQADSTGQPPPAAEKK